MLKRVERRGAAASAKLLRTWIGGVFRYAAGELLVDADPTWPLRNTIRAPKTKHIQHLSAKAIPAFLQALERVQAEYATMVAAKLLWLTVVRTIELRAAEWSEFDFDARLWTIPAERMKMREPHVVPLSEQAIELLRTLQPLTGRGRYVFPGRKDREQPLTHEAIRDVFNRAGYAGKFTPHGVRSTFSTYFNEADADHELIELGSPMRSATRCGAHTTTPRSWSSAGSFCSNGRTCRMHGGRVRRCCRSGLHDDFAA